MDAKSIGNESSKILQSEDQYLGSFIDPISEKTILSVVLTDEGYSHIEDPESITKYFYYDEHRKCYERILEIIEQNGSHDMATITQNVTDEQAELLMECYQVNPIGVSDGVGQYVGAFLDAMRRCWQRRMIYLWKHENEPWQWDNPAEEIEQAQEYFEDVRLQQSNTSIQGVQEGVDDLREIMQSKGPDGLPAKNMRTGMTKLDDATYGIAPTDFWILSAQAGIGKTTFALQLANFVAEKYGDVLIISGEMEPYEICMKMIARNKSISIDRMMREQMQDEDWEKYVNGEEKLLNSNLHIVSNRRLNVYDIASSVRQIKRNHDLRLVILDYFQLVQNHRKDEMDRYDFYDYLSVWLTDFTSEVEVPFFCISRENRQQGMYGTTQPDYDCNYHLKMIQPDEDSNERLVHVKKGRLGPGGTVRLEMQGEYSRFIDPAMGDAVVS